MYEYHTKGLIPHLPEGRCKESLNIRSVKYCFQLGGGGSPVEDYNSRVISNMHLSDSLPPDLLYLCLCLTTVIFPHFR